MREKKERKNKVDTENALEFEVLERNDLVRNLLRKQENVTIGSSNVF